jgi:hypothetical protein
MLLKLGSKVSSATVVDIRTATPSKLAKKNSVCFGSDAPGFFVGFLHLTLHLENLATSLLLKPTLVGGSIRAMTTVRKSAVTWTCVLLSVTTCLSGCGLLSKSPNAANQAEEFTQLGQYEEAIQLYREHIESRLSVSNRAEWENPHFYLLRIGDLYLRMEQPQAAIDAYRDAEAHKVEDSLISDRYRALAHWYIEHNQLQAAFDLLKTYRGKDSLLFDAMLDRVGRAMTAQETAGRVK